MKKVSKPVFYFLGILFFLIATGGWGLMSVSGSQLWYVLGQLTALGLGIGHVHLLYRFAPALDGNQLLPGLLATILLTIGGLLGIIGMYMWFFPTQNYAFSTCVIPFLIPYVFAWVYRYYLAIPMAEYKKWYYPLGKPTPDLDLIDLSKILIIQFEFTKKMNDQALTNFKAKAPLQMTLGELFLIFLNDYNEQNSGNSIQFLSERNTPLGWHFYYRKSKFSSRRYFDPDLSFQQNNITDNLIITAERS